MIAGEFDLSSGVMIGTSGLLCGLLTTEYGIPMWPAILHHVRLRRRGSA